MLAVRVRERSAEEVHDSSRTGRDVSRHAKQGHHGRRNKRLPRRKYVEWLDLSHNHISELSPSLFDTIDNLRYLDLSHNNISVIEGTFPRRLRTLALRGNRIAKLSSGVFSSGHLRNLFLDDNGMREVESGAFDAVPKLEHVWMGGNVLNCSRVQLPDGAQCLEAACGVDYLFWVGDGNCNSQVDPEYDTAQCAWDGGDC